jgi:hypothetical protein
LSRWKEGARQEKTPELVDTEGLVLSAAKVMSAKIPEQEDGLKMLLLSRPERAFRISEAPVVGCGLRGQGQALGREEVL